MTRASSSLASLGASTDPAWSRRIRRERTRQVAESMAQRREALAPRNEASVGVLVVDDEELFRRVLRDLVIATPGLELVGEAASGEAALEAVDMLSPQMVIMDKRMPGMGGIEATRLVTVRDPDLVVLLVSIETPEPDLVSSSGAAAFVPKQQRSPRVLTALWL